MMNKSLLWIFSLLFVVAFISACGDKDKPEYFPPRADNRVYFVYMAASERNIRPFSEVNLADMKRAATKKNIGEGRILVFYDQGNGANTKMLEIKAGSNGNGVIEELNDYGQDLNTGKPETFLRALQDMKYYAELDGQIVDSYILDMWSHGDAWEFHSRTTSADMGIAPMSVATDGGSYLELEEFAGAINDFSDEYGISFDAVVFAQCYGASIEMLYLLRNSTDIVIGSAPEMPMYGMPYHKVLSSIFAPTFDYKGVVDGYCSFYDNYPLVDEYQQGIFWRNSGTMAAFDCNAFTDDGFVSTMRSIYASDEYRQALADFSAASSASGGEEIGVQSYSWNAPYKYFDVGDFVNQIETRFAGSGEEFIDLCREFREQMNDIVLYKRTGGKIFYDYIVIDRNKFTGMSTYIMLNTNRYTTKNNQYKNTEWYKAVYQ